MYSKNIFDYSELDVYIFDFSDCYLNEIIDLINVDAFFYRYFQ